MNSENDTSADIEPITSSRLTDLAYEAITAWIVNGELHPGDRLDVKWLAKKLEVSLTPVKNALSLLANEGLVQIIPRNGTYVTSVSRRSLEEVMRIREAFELLAAETLTRIAEPELIEELFNLVDSIENAPNVAAHYRRNAEFHQRLIERSDNQMLAALYRQLHAHIYQALFYAGRSTWKTRARLEAEEHRAIVKALAAHDADALKRAICAHLKTGAPEVEGGGDH